MFVTVCIILNAIISAGPISRATFVRFLTETLSIPEGMDVRHMTIMKSVIYTWDG